MTFVTVSSNREQLTMLSRVLVMLFPGCTIHQNCDPMRAIWRMSNQKVDAMIADMDTCKNMMNLLNGKHRNTQICLLCRQDASLPEEIVNVDDVVSYPITEQKMRTTLLRLSKDKG